MGAAMLAIFVVYTMTAALFIGLALPLIWEAVPPNRWYGFRTRRTLSEPAVWYAVNRVTGWWLLATGVLMAVVACGTYGLALPVDQAAWINQSVCLAGLIGMVWHGVVLLRRPPADGPSASSLPHSNSDSS
jgi:arginine exporter protein ArgO